MKGRKDLNQYLADVCKINQASISRKLNEKCQFKANEITSIHQD